MRNALILDATDWLRPRETLVHQRPLMANMSNVRRLWQQSDGLDVQAIVPISPPVREALERILRERPGIGKALLFPSWDDPQKPISRHLADAWLRKGEALAKLEPQKGSLWHAYRRKWATERKHMPDVDVATAGGWETVQTLQSAYQQADAETMLLVVIEAGELREAK